MNTIVYTSKKGYNDFIRRCARMIIDGIYSPG